MKLLPLPFRRALAPAMLVAGLLPVAAPVMAPATAHAKDHSFHIPRRSHAPSPYGNVSGYQVAMDRKSPEYIKVAQVCETTSAMGMYSTANSNRMSMNRNDHSRFYAQCMVSHGAWRSASQTSGRDMGGDDSFR